MNNLKIGFIGGGNMARSLIGGLIASGASNEKILVSAIDETHLSSLRTDFGIRTTTNNQDIVDECDVVVFAVKPQVLKDVCTALNTRSECLYLTVAAGIPTSSLMNWLGSDLAIVRAMPNTPALLRAGATALFANQHTSEEQKESAESIMRAVGLALWVNTEAQMDAVTALSGSGPAYFFQLMEHMITAAHDLGLDANTARLLTVQTAFGAAKMALEIEKDPATLRQNVTSPGGTTEQAINTFAEGGFEQLVNQALRAARDRAEELAKDLGQ
ncbi:MAG: pyrroline-5-carboxylate reductase [Gammaproteobacteria bacterium]|nr:pyrroline-5-carboxylate reductase [Gammaproteobacteria bacterium]